MQAPHGLEVSASMVEHGRIGQHDGFNAEVGVREASPPDILFRLAALLQVDAHPIPEHKILIKSFIIPIQHCDQLFEPMALLVWMLLFGPSVV